MPTQLARANGNGTLNASGTHARAVVLVDIADILAAVGIGAAEKRAQALSRLLAELHTAVVNDARTDAAIDQQVADATARAAAEKAARPTGGL